MMRGSRRSRGKRGFHSPVVAPSQPETTTIAAVANGSGQQLVWMLWSERLGVSCGCLSIVRRQLKASRASSFVTFSEFGVLSPGVVPSPRESLFAGFFAP